MAIYTTLLFNWARSSGLQRADASDVVQDVLTVVLRELPTYQPTPQARFRSWLWAITRNRLRAFHRRRIPTPMDDLEPMVEDQPPAESAEEELRGLVCRAAELLQDEFQPTTWKAFWETAVAGRSGKEVAHDLGMSVGAVYAARFRVQRRIRDELAGFLD